MRARRWQGPAHGVMAMGSQSLILSIQSGTINLSTAQTSNTATINGVAPDHAMVLHGGVSAGGAFTSRMDNGVRLALTNGTTVTATRNNTDGGGGNTAVDVTYTVIELKPGIIKSIQRSTITVNGVASNTATISAVDTAKSFVNNLGTSTDTGQNTSGLADFLLTNATTVTMTRAGSTGIAIGSFEVIEFY